MTDVTAQSIEAALTAFIASDPGNAMPAHNNMRMYDAPLIGYASADDAYFESFKNPEIIGERFLTPETWLPGAHTVISYFLPFTEEVRKSNRTPGLPSEEWVSGRIDGEEFNNTARRFLAAYLDTLGQQAIAPALDSRCVTVDRVCNWSERHAAFVAGLGTFSLSRSLITKKGSAGRIGSVITTLELPATERPYQTYYDYCPFLVNGKCGACIRRCPPKAISPAGKNNQVCSDYLDNEVRPLFAPRYGCAKCNTAVPCEYRIPTI